MMSLRNGRCSDSTRAKYLRGRYQGPAISISIEVAVWGNDEVTHVLIGEKLIRGNKYDEMRWRRNMGIG